MIRILTGNVFDILPTLRERSVQTCITSPAYWGLRDYGTPGQLGLEKTPQEYVANLVAVFREVRRVLRDDGVLFVNLGDSYFGDSPARKSSAEAFSETWNPADSAGNGGLRRSAARVGSLKPKDLVGIPWRVAFALQDDGWWLRSDIIWAKPNPMPESVTDRPTKAHEYIFLLAKSQRYYWDAEAVREANVEPKGNGGWQNAIRQGEPDRYQGAYPPNKTQGGAGGSKFMRGEHVHTGGRNLRTVWTIATHPYSGAHFATFPPALVEPMVKASTSERGCCPKCGKAWERVVERSNPSKQANTGPDERYGSLDNMGGNHQTVAGLHRNGGGVYSSAETTGWRPGCACDAGEPPTRLDDEDEFDRTWRGEDFADDEPEPEPYVPTPYPPVPCTVLDPFGGAGTTGLVASRLGRDAVLIELNPEYAEMARKRIRDDAPLLAT